LRQTSRAKRPAVKAITDSQKSRQRADQLIRGVFGEFFRRIRETAQAYAHFETAPISTDEQTIQDAWVAAAWNRYVEKHHPGLNARLELYGSHDRGGLRFVEKGGGAGRTGLDREIRDLTAAEFCQITSVLLEANSAPVDSAAFRAEANPAWDKLRHRVLGKKIKDDLIERDRLDGLADNQAAEFGRAIRRVRGVVEKQVRGDPNCKGAPVVLPAPFRSDPASD
jgi:hypothetical protein